MRKMALIPLALLVGACGTSDTDDEAKENAAQFASDIAQARADAAKQTNDVETLERAVTRDLPNAQAVRFRNLVYNPSGYLCGELNAQNSSGTYTGFTKFWTAHGGGVVASALGSSGPDVEKKLASFCDPNRGAKPVR